MKKFTLLLTIMISFLVANAQEKSFFRVGDNATISVPNSIAGSSSVDGGNWDTWFLTNLNPNSKIISIGGQYSLLEGGGGSYKYLLENAEEHYDYNQSSVFIQRKYTQGTIEITRFLFNFQTDQFFSCGIEVKTEDYGKLLSTIKDILSSMVLDGCIDNYPTVFDFGHYADGSTKLMEYRQQYNNGKSFKFPQYCVKKGESDCINMYKNEQNSTYPNEISSFWCNTCPTMDGDGSQTVVELYNQLSNYYDIKCDGNSFMYQKYNQEDGTIEFCRYIYPHIEGEDCLMLSVSCRWQNVVAAFPKIKQMLLSMNMNGYTPKTTTQIAGFEDIKYKKVINYDSLYTTLRRQYPLENHANISLNISRGSVYETHLFSDDDYYTDFDIKISTANSPCRYHVNKYIIHYYSYGSLIRAKEYYDDFYLTPNTYTTLSKSIFFDETCSEIKIIFEDYEIYK